MVIFVAAALLLAGVGFALYHQSVANERALYEQAVIHHVDIHTDVINRELKAVESDLLYLANQAVLLDFLEGRPASRAALESEYLLLCRERGLYDQVRYLDATGREQVRINYNDGRPVVVSHRELQSKADRYYFRQSFPLARGEVFISPFDLNIEHGRIEWPHKPMIRFAIPVFDRSGIKRGIFILNYLGAALLDKLARASAGFPGVVWLLNPDGYFLRGPAAEDEWGFMLGHRRTFASRFPDAWPRVAGAGPDVFQTDLGLFAYRPISLAPGSAASGSSRAPPATAPGRGRRQVWVILVAHIPPRVLEGPPARWLRHLLVLCGVVLLLVIVFAWYLAYAGVMRRYHQKHLADSEARLRTLSKQLLTAQEDERRSVSRDLHDELGQVVTSITLDLERAAQARDTERKDALIGRAQHAAGCLLDRLHEISTRLRPTLLDDLGLKDAVQCYLSQYEQRTGIAARPELCFERTVIPPAVSENVFRILQEALTNVAKHAGAGEVMIGLRVTDGGVTLTVRDTGVGMAPDALEGKRLGILGMRERAELLDGNLVVKTGPGAGTEIQVTIPIPQVIVPGRGPG
jgi:signal transduction histidine kinase